MYIKMNEFRIEMSVKLYGKSTSSNVNNVKLQCAMLRSVISNLRKEKKRKRFNENLLYFKYIYIHIYI